MGARLIRSSLAALAAGLTQALAIANPWNGEPLWWLQLASLALLGWLLMAPSGQAAGLSLRRRPSGPSWRRGAWFGWLFATAWLAGTWWWLFISLHTYGGLAAPLAVLAVGALAGALALYYTAACAVFLMLISRQPRTQPWFSALVFASLWTLAELARARWFTGFPWGMGAYAHTGGPLAALAPWIGAYGIGFVAAWLALTAAALLHRVAVRGPLQSAGALALALAGLLALPALTRPFSVPAGALDVALLQGNIAQDQKFQPGTGVADALRWYGQALLDNRAALVVAPETAIPLLPVQLPDGYWASLEARFASGEQAALIGIPMGNLRLGYTNSVMGLRPGQAAPYTYDKHHLVPFGEFVPPFFRWFLDLMHIPLGDFNRGPLTAPSFQWQGQRLAPNICYEDLFGEELGARFSDPAIAPTIMVNVSNIAWFGDSLAIDQHLQISRMRALEFERPMLRATNTGATVIINHRGEVTHSLPRHTRGILTGTVQGRAGLTPYAMWVSRLGLWPVWLLALAVVTAAALRRRPRDVRAWD